MNNKEIQSTIYQFYHLMKAAQGNVFNCIYIECTNCKYPDSGCCGDFIFSTLLNGSPVLLPISDINIMQGFSQDKSDYLGVISNARFNDLFFLFLTETIDSTANTCPISALFAAQKSYFENFVKTAQKLQ